MKCRTCLQPILPDERYNRDPLFLGAQHERCREEKGQKAVPK